MFPLVRDLNYGNDGFTLYPESPSICVCARTRVLRAYSNQAREGKDGRERDKSLLADIYARENPYKRNFVTGGSLTRYYRVTDSYGLAKREEYP